MDCERIKSLLSDWLDGSIAGSDLAEVTAHLRECRPCSAEAEGLKGTIALLRGLPPVKAPPELMEKVRLGIGQERASRPLWKKLFLPAHVKIPLEAAAVVLLFLLVVATQKEQLPKGISSWTATGREAALSAQGGKEKTGGPPAAAPTGKTRNAVPAGGKPVPVRRGGGAPRQDAPGGVAHPAAGSGVLQAHGAPSSRNALPEAKNSLPTVPAQRISTAAGRIEPAPVPEENAREIGPPPRLFAAPPSRILRQVPYGREVTIEVTREHRAGLEERIAAAALRLGGTVARDPSRPVASENGALRDQVRVHVPSDSAEIFLAELSQLGTLPLEGMPGWADFPAGPSTGVVAYAVRIRVK